MISGTKPIDKVAGVNELSGKETLSMLMGIFIRPGGPFSFKGKGDKRYVYRRAGGQALEPSAEPGPTRNVSRPVSIGLSNSRKEAEISALL